MKSARGGKPGFHKGNLGHTSILGGSAQGSPNVPFQIQKTIYNETGEYKILLSIDRKGQMANQLIATKCQSTSASSTAWIVPFTVSIRFFG